MKQHTIGIIMNGVTGRMGTNQHLLRSIAEIMKQGGVKLSNGETIMPDPILIGRDESKLKRLCALTGITNMSTNLEDALKSSHYSIYFDAQTTGRRADAVKAAIKAGNTFIVKNQLPSAPNRLWSCTNWPPRLASKTG
nr:hypothetical protein [Haliscomenobacter sp.]